MLWLRHALVMEYNDLSDADCIFLIAYYQCGQKFNLFEKFEKKSYPLAFYNYSKPLNLQELPADSGHYQNNFKIINNNNKHNNDNLAVDIPLAG